MSPIRFTPIPTEHAQSYWGGAIDAHGLIPERHVSDGTGIPCRHCLNEVPANVPYLILAYRPFVQLQPYAEVGPVFLHAEPCTPYENMDATPSMFLGGEPRLLKAYNNENRIIYGTGKIVEPQDMAGYASELLDDPTVAYVHVRSSQNNCFSCRVDRA